MFTWLHKYKFQAHLVGFLLMALSSAGMILQMQSENVVFIWLMIVIFAAANLLAIFIK